MKDRQGFRYVAEEPAAALDEDCIELMFSGVADHAVEIIPTIGVRSALDINIDVDQFPLGIVIHFIGEELKLIGKAVQLSIGFCADAAIDDHTLAGWLLLRNDMNNSIWHGTAPPKT